MIGKRITLDFRKKDENKYPKIIMKEETDSHLRLHLEFEDGKNFIGDVVTISTNGKYVVEIVDKI